MITLALRTDKPEDELYIYEGQTKKAEIKWQAHLKLSETLNSKVEEILTLWNAGENQQYLTSQVLFHKPDKSKLALADIEGIAVYKGPGSFTGLRIGITVANALAYSFSIPIVASGGSDWIKKAISSLEKGENDKIAMPEYGSEAHTTQPRK